MTWCCIRPRPAKGDDKSKSLVRPYMNTDSQARATSAPIDQLQHGSMDLRQRLAKSLDILRPRDSKPDPLDSTRAQHLEDMFHIEQKILDLSKE